MRFISVVSMKRPMSFGFDCKGWITSSLSTLSNVDTGLIVAMNPA